MTKNLKTSYILYLVFASVIIAWQTIFSYFGGVGIGFVAVLLLFSAILTLKILDQHTSNRTKDLFILGIVFSSLELLIYFFIEFKVGSWDALNVFYVIQNVISFLAIFLLVYTMFRFLTEIKNVKISFVECLLGNSKGKKKARKTKELSNGSLEEKPNKTAPSETTEQLEQDDPTDQTNAEENVEQ